MNRPVHFEILSANPKESVAFYEKVFGWKAATWDGPQAYWLLTTGEGEPGINGGLMERHFPQAVINTISVESMEATVDKIEKAGGKKVHGPETIPGVGKHAYCSDPEGTLFGILQPGEE